MANVICRDFRIYSKFYHFCRKGVCQQPITYVFCLQNHTLSGPKLGPRDMLVEKTKKGELLRDELQTTISESLQIVYEDIKDYKPQGQTIFSKFFSPKKKIPKGLYIYGAVGNKFNNGLFTKTILCSIIISIYIFYLSILIKNI